MDDPTRPWGIFLCLLAVLLGAAFFFHEPTVSAPIAYPQYCDGGDDLYYLCTDPWVNREFDI